MKIIKKNINEIKFDPANARKHSARNLKAIKDSLEIFGQQKPIVIDKRGVVIAGNGTLQAAIELSWTEIDAVETQLDPAHAQAFGIADNRTAELAEWDNEVLGELLEGMDADLVGILSMDDLKLPDAVKDQPDLSDSIEFGYRIEITVENEKEQEELYNRLKSEGLECRLLTL